MALITSVAGQVNLAPPEPAELDLLCPTPGSYVLFQGECLHGAAGAADPTLEQLPLPHSLEQLPLSPLSHAALFSIPGLLEQLPLSPFSHRCGSFLHSWYCAGCSRNTCWTERSLNTPRRRHLSTVRRYLSTARRHLSTACARVSAGVLPELWSEGEGAEELEEPVAGEASVAMRTTLLVNWWVEAQGGRPSGPACSVPPAEMTAAMRAAGGDTDWPRPPPPHTTSADGCAARPPPAHWGPGLHRLPECIE